MNWEGVGVVSDIAAPTDRALVVAMNLMRHRLGGGSPPGAAAQ